MWICALLISNLWYSILEFVWWSEPSIRESAQDKRFSRPEWNRFYCLDLGITPNYWYQEIMWLTICKWQDEKFTIMRLYWTSNSFWFGGTSIFVEVLDFHWTLMWGCKSLLRLSLEFQWAKILGCKSVF